jgi:hypothetical protein
MAKAFGQAVPPFKEVAIGGSIEIRCQPIAALDFGTGMWWLYPPGAGCVGEWSLR